MGAGCQEIQLCDWVRTFSPTSDHGEGEGVEVESTINGECITQSCLHKTQEDGFGEIPGWPCGDARKVKLWTWKLHVLCHIRCPVLLFHLMCLSYTSFYKKPVIYKAHVSLSSVGHCRALIEAKAGVWEPLIYSQLVRSACDNLDLPLAFWVEGVIGNLQAIASWSEALRAGLQLTS